MPSTPPPPPFPPVASPPTSPQLHQEAVRRQERLQRLMGSPELRRVPSASTIPMPPPPLPPSPPRPVSAPVTFNGQSFNHLPAHLAAHMRDLQPFPIPRIRQRRVPVSYFLFLLIYNIMLNGILYRLLPLLH
jgi:hypothetical protein